MTSVITAALVGYGRFGRAFASLLGEAGIDHRGYDVGEEVPQAHRAPSLTALLDGVQFVVIAVPVGEIGEVARALRPLLTPEQVVFDVGSVKMRPEAALGSVFGRDIPWVATHPLFGPASLALAARPLRAVVCPSALHPRAERAVRDLYRDLGCEVIMQSAEEHDRIMARTHALAFFLAKGMIDIGAGADLPFTPPSFAAMARTIDSVRADAGHLFVAIQNENPFAAEARRELLQALGSIDEALAGAGAEDATAGRARIAIPDLGARAPDLLMTRELIDGVDREILALLARRAELSRRAARAKAGLGQPVLDPAREEALLAERRRWAEESALCPEDIAEIFRAVIRFSRRVQR